MIQAWAIAIAATGADSGWSSMRTTATATNGTTCATVVSVQSCPRRRSVSSLARRRQGTAASSGRPGWKPAASIGALPAGYGAPEYDRGGVDRQLPHLRRLPRAVAHDADVALVKLATEGLHRR